MTKAVLFDMDGVIVDSTPAHFRAWRAMARENGGDIDFETFRPTIGTGNADTIVALFGSGRDEDWMRRLADRKEKIYRAEIVNAFQPVPGVSSLIRSLSGAGWRLALATSAPSENVDLIMSLLDGGDLVKTRVDASGVARHKPDPEVFLKAAEKLDAAPGECVVVEDGLAGLRGARSVGMATLAVATTMTHDELRPFADAVVDDLTGVTADFLASLLQGGV